MACYTCKRLTGQIYRGWCVYVCMYEAAGVRPHTPLCVFQLVIASLPASPLQWGRSDDPGTTTTSCPHTPFLCWHLWWRAGPPWVAAIRQALFDPFHIRLNCRDPVSQLESLLKGICIHVRFVINRMDKNHESSHSEYPGSRWSRIWLSSWKTLFQLYCGTAPTPSSLASRDTTCWRNVDDHTKTDLCVWSEGSHHDKNILSPVLNQLKFKPHSNVNVTH